MCGGGEFPGRALKRRYQRRFHTAAASFAYLFGEGQTHSNFQKVLLRMGAYLSRRSRGHELLSNPKPVLSQFTEAVEELVMFFLGPPSFSFTRS